MYKMGVWFLGDLYKVISKELDGNYSVIGVYDINDDGVSELILRTFHSIRCYSTVSGEMLWKIDFFYGRIINISIRDVNLDGLDELLILVNIDNENKLYIVDNSGTILTEINLGADVPLLERIRSFKMKDGKINFVLPLDSKLLFFDLDGNMVWSFIPPPNTFFIYRLNDYDSDGFLEILIIYGSDNHILLEVTDLNTTKTEWTLEIPWNNSDRPFIEEKQLDNSIAIFLFLQNYLYIIDSQEGAILYQRELKEIELFNGTADVDGDGRKEIILCGIMEPSYESVLEIFYPSTGESIRHVFQEPVIDCRIGDYDGDKKDEICIIGNNNVAFFDSEGIIWEVKNLFKNSIYHSFGEDFDRDGLTEILVIGEKGAAILDLKGKEILWMDEHVVINELGDLINLGNIISVDIDNDDEEEWLIIDEENLRIIALKGAYGVINELWSLKFHGSEIYDIQITFPRVSIIVVIDDKIYSIDPNGEIKWVCNSCPSSYIFSGEINGDGKPEIIVYHDRNGVKVLRYDDGKTLWSLPEKADLIRLGDLNGNGIQELILVRNRIINILNGENGKIELTKILEFPISRIDVLDLDSDSMDEILVFGDGLVFLIKNFNQIWERKFIDAQKIREILTCHFTSKRHKDICLIGDNDIYIFDGKTGKLIHYEKIRKVQRNSILVGDFNGDGFD